MNDNNLARRRFLRGLTLGIGGATYLTPMLQSLALAAEGVERKSPRFLFVLEGNGLPPAQLHPRNLPFVPRDDRKRLTSHRLEAEHLPTSLQPVARYVDRMVVLQGINGEVCGGGHSTSHGALGAYNTRDGKVIHDATIDYVLGRHAKTVFEQVVLGISAQDRDVVFNCSATGPGQSAATFCNPTAAYQRIFGPIAAGGSPREQAYLLDYLKEDIKTARRSLPTVQAGKLDMYLEAYENIQVRNRRVKELADGNPLEAYEPSDRFRSPLPEDRLDAHFELATTTLVSGLSDVVTIASGVGFRHFNIQFSKLAGQSKHPMGHAIIAGDKGAIAEAEAIRAYHFQLIARTMDKLASIPEGDGSMLDNTVIVYLSDSADTHHTRCLEWPYVLLGGSPRLKLDGRYLVYPDRGQAGWRTVNTIHNSLLYAAGLPADSFGHLMKGIAGDVQMGPLQEVLA
ncbi:DUF1552 domain-containing protein [Blastopirellula marina]|uniref:DUF1552 domain-containing protein n=1 Tax=Blastopirellula marina TaxID=124 RepID=A0A2S8FAU5_9BACT|nr:DUF1552 domain-containing protein [Blastopirellula marina]PQO29054.1 hypothetical protein C5Y98_22885 [Blastopirellula marina]PTL42325.1 DUF1552 domain-containing protein [Blastopirellula marina]